jgi:hypothetical protein
MPKKHTVLHEEQQAKLIELLNRRLADAIDLQVQSRQLSREGLHLTLFITLRRYT